MIAPYLVHRIVSTKGQTIMSTCIDLYRVVIPILTACFGDFK